MAYDNTNRGVLFPNDKKTTDRHPTHTGKINIDGTEFYLSAWSQKSKQGKPYVSLSIGDAVDDAGGYEDQQDRSQSQSDFDDDIPF